MFRSVAHLRRRFEGGVWDVYGVALTFFMPKVCNNNQLLPPLEQSQDHLTLSTATLFDWALPWSFFGAMVSTEVRLKWMKFEFLASLEGKIVMNGRLQATKQVIRLYDSSHRC